MLLFILETLVVIFLLITDVISVTPCNGNSPVGESNPNSKNDGVDTEIGVAILMYQDEFQFDCCGFVYEWQFNADAGYTGEPFDLQVWRENPGQIFDIIGSITLNSTDPETVIIPNGERIRVNTGDFIGIHATGSFPIRWGSVGGGSQGRLKLTNITTTMTTPYNWSMAVNSNDRDYAVHGKVTKGSTPSFLGVTDVGVYNDEITIGQVVASIVVTDVDIEDAVNLKLTLLSATNSGATYFDFAVGSENLTVIAIPPVGDYTITMKVEDPCTLSSTSNLKVTILNRPPDINNMPSSVTIGEDAADVLIFTINATDTVTEPLTCSLESGDTSKFEVKLIPPSTSSFGVYSKSTATYNYDTQSSYTVRVKCDDGDDTVEEDLIINLTRNEPPTINNLPPNTNISEDVSNRTLLHTMNVTDPTDDAFTCSISPASSVFDVSLLPSTTSYGIYLTGGTTLDYDTKSTYVLPVECADQRRSDTHDYTVNLIRNTPPVITSLPASTNLSEDLSTRTLLHNLTIMDVDVSDVHTCVLASPSTVFEVAEIVPSSGQYGVYLSGGTTLNYDITPSYVVSVTCSDHRRGDTKDLTVDLIINEPPTINNVPANTNISEDISTRTLLHTMNVTDPTDDVFTCSISPASSVFDVSLVPSTTSYGIYLTGGTTLDYDTKSTYVLPVECADQRRSDTQDYTVNLIRNTPPLITSLPASTNISEDLSTRTLLHNLTITDVDVSDIHTCVLASPSSVFDVTEIVPSSGQYGVYLSGGTTLNYDITPSYVVSVICNDHRRGDTKDLIIGLIINEPPTINNLPANTNISEDLSIRTLLSTMNVTDPTDDAFTCSISPASSVFDVSLIPSTSSYGIYLTGGTALDYDTKSTYVLPVECADQRRSDTQDYTINLIRNTPPVISSLPASTNISENLSTRTLLHNLTITDVDVSDVHICVLASPSSVFDVTEIVPSSGQYGVYLSGGTTLNYDITPSYVVSVICSDHRRGDTKDLTVDLIINEPPSINSLPENTNISEDLSTRTLLHTINVTDATDDSVTCSIIPASSVFDVSLVPFTTSYGIYLTGGTTLDYDTKSTYVVPVECADQRRSDTQDYTVNLMRNTPPDITSLPASTNISEDLSTRTLLHTLTITDVDVSDVHTCVLASPSSVFDVAEIVPSSGQYGVYLSGGTTLDFDITPSYVVSVTCSDHRRGDTKDLTVDIIRNEPPTVQTLPSSVEISEDTSTVTLLYTVVTTDPTNDSVTCVITTTTSKFFMQIGSDQYHNDVYVKSNVNFDYDVQKMYRLDISCADHRRSVSSFLFIYLIRNMPPHFTNLQGNTIVDSFTSTAGKLVFTITAEDPESDILLYTMTASANHPFTINQNNGEVSLTRSIKTEALTAYDLSVYIDDGRNTVGPGILTVIIKSINPINRAPILTNLPQTIRIYEGLTVGSVIFQVLFKDYEPADIHQFSVVYNPPDGTVYFNLNQTDGRLILISEIDYETIPYKEFTVNVTVTDSYMEDTGTLTVEILNVNEPPHFIKTGYSLTASEAGAGTVLPDPHYQYFDEDGDTVHFNLDCSDKTGRFQMNSVSGLFSYSIEYDLDVTGTPSLIQCKVFINDNEFSDSADVNITVLDANDNKPRFQHRLYTCFVPLDSVAGTYVGEVLATDDDIGNYGKFIYYIQQDTIKNGVFEILANGTIQTKELLTDYTEGSSLNFKVYAADTGGLESFTTVKIVIPDTSTDTNLIIDDTISYYTFFTYAPNMAWFVPAMCMVLIACGALIYMFQSCVEYACESSEVKQLTQIPRRRQLRY